MQSQHYNQQNKFNHRISDTNNNKLRTHGSILNISWDSGLLFWWSSKDSSDFIEKKDS